MACPLGRPEGAQAPWHPDKPREGPLKSRRTYTVIRGKNFVRIRRQFIRAARELDALGYVPWWRARTLCAFWGQLKYTDSIYFCQTYDAYRIFKAARRSVAWKARKEAQRGAVCQAAG